MSIKPKSMTVVFDDKKEMDRISNLFCYYTDAVERSNGTRFGIKPPIIKMFSAEYRVTSIASDNEVVGYNPTSLSDPVFSGRVVKPTLTVTLERVEL